MASPRPLLIGPDPAAGPDRVFTVIRDGAGRVIDVVTQILPAPKPYAVDELLNAGTRYATDWHRLPPWATIAHPVRRRGRHWTVGPSDIPHASIAAAVKYWSRQYRGVRVRHESGRLLFRLPRRWRTNNDLHTIAAIEWLVPRAVAKGRAHGALYARGYGMSRRRFLESGVA